MTTQEILDQLKVYTGTFPEKALKAAVAQREEIIPHLHRIIEAVAADPVASARDREKMDHVFAVFLLAQFQETSAFEPLVRILESPGETPFDLFGDTITEALPRLLGTLYDGHSDRLLRLITSESVNEFVRGAALDAFVVLAYAGKMRREEVIGCFRGLFENGLERRLSHAWSALVSACADLPAPELLPEIRGAYQKGFVDEEFAELEEIERDLLLKPGARQPRSENYSLVTDAIAETEWWASWVGDEPGPRPSHAPILRPPLPYLSQPVQEPQTILRDEVKVGRNDLCPCGSGKKYKKCCLNKPA